MDLTEALQRGYFTALQRLGHQVYSAYSVPEQVEYPFILIGTITSNQVGVDRPCVIHEAFVTIDIVTGFLSPVGRAQALTISAQVENIINPDSGYPFPIPSPWTNTGTTLQNSGTLESKSNNYYIYRVVKTYRHLISKNNG